MPFAPKHPCNRPGCPNLTNTRFCVHHDREDRQRLESQRLSASERGYDARWHKASILHLLKHPLCAICAGNGRLEQAILTDHIIPHKGDMKLFWDESNWQSLCKKCHDSKTAREDGRWGDAPGGGSL